MKLVRIKNRLARFARGSQGSVSVEFVLIMPLLFWAYMASYVFFDGFRQSTIDLKAAYTIGDLVSRETEAITPAYVDSMYSLLGVLTRSSSPTTLRLSVVRWDQADNRYYVDWSQARGTGVLPMDNTSVLDVADKLPYMPDNERVILVETTNSFVPLFNVGLANISLDNFVFTRPRFAPQVVFASS